MRELQTDIPVSNKREFWNSINPALPDFIEQQRWYASKTVGVKSASISSSLAISDDLALVIVDVTNKDLTTEQYSMALAHSVVDAASPICRLLIDGASIEVAETSNDPIFWKRLLQTVSSDSNYCVTSSPAALAWTRDEIESWEIKIHAGEQSNTSIELGVRYFLKLFRKVVVGINPDVEVGRFLSQSSSFRNSPAVVQTLDFVPSPGDSACLIMVSERIACECDGWTFALQRLDDFWQRVLSRSETDPTVVLTTIDWQLDSVSSPIDSNVLDVIGEIADDAFLLGKRSRELHAAMQSEDDPAFTHEPTTLASIAQLVSGLQDEIQSTCRLLRQAELPIENITELSDLLETRAQALLEEWRQNSSGFTLPLSRVHGDYHLGQVLRTADDFVIIDFEGEPDRSLAERRAKRSVMKDVAGMIRSLHYASNAATVGLIKSLQGIEQTPAISAWQTAWFQTSAQAFLRGYSEGNSGLTDSTGNCDEAQRFLDLFLLEKSFYELRYEINNRPTWVQIPLNGLTALLSIDD